MNLPIVTFNTIPRDHGLREFKSTSDEKASSQVPFFDKWFSDEVFQRLLFIDTFSYVKIRHSTVAQHYPHILNNFLKKLTSTLTDDTSLQLRAIWPNDF